jgi:protein-S-isoprenylcysteine O-methyltransferase Ste14
MVTQRGKHVCEPDESLLVHAVLAHSYLVYFAGIVVGLFVDIFFGWRISSLYVLPILGFIFLLSGSLIVLWAQKTSRKTSPGRNSGTLSIDDFLHGPYRFTRAPTQLGLFLLILGFGLFLNSLSVVGLTVIIYAVSLSVFIPREEKRLLAKYGDPYLAYLKKVRL